MDAKYFGYFLVVSEGVSEVALSLVAPSVRMAVASISQSNVEVSARAIADVVHKLIRASLVVLIWVFSIFGV